MKTKIMSEFEEFKIDNLQKVIGGEIISFNTSENGKVTDHVDVTYNEYGQGSQDGFGGGGCDIAVNDTSISQSYYTAYMEDPLP